MEVPEIDVDGLEEALDAGAPLFDVRQPVEYEEARVPGGTLIPLDTVPESLDSFPRDRTVYVVCRSGARSGRAVEFLRSNGVDAVNVTGGTLAWMESGRTVDRGA